MASIKIYNDVVGSPHTFIGITDDYGNTIYRGFAPKETGFFGAGEVRDELDYNNNKLHEYTLEPKEIFISTEQYNKLIANVEASQKNPPSYELPFGSQCTVWVMDMLNKSGIVNIPVSLDINPLYKSPAGALQSILFNPYTFWIADGVNNFLDIVSKYTDKLKNLLTIGEKADIAYNELYDELGEKYASLVNELLNEYKEIEKKTPSEPKLEIAILSDTTGSMSGEINSVKAQAKNIVETAFSKDENARIGVFGYNDPDVQTFAGLTNNKSAIISAINALYAIDGGDTPEMTYKGIINAASSSWSPNADKKIIIFFSSPI